MTVKRIKDTRTPRVVMHRVADIPGGVSVKTAELGADWLPEGAALSAPENGICHVVKTSEVAAAVAESATSITVKKGTLFNVGDIVMAKEGDKASKITAIDRTAKDTDKITISAAIGAIALGGAIAEAKAASTGTTSALKYEPKAIVGTGKPVINGENIDTDAWLIAVTKGNALPDCVASKLKGIINY